MLVFEIPRNVVYYRLFISHKYMAWDGALKGMVRGLKNHDIKLLTAPSGFGMDYMLLFRRLHHFKSNPSHKGETDDRYH